MVQKAEARSIIVAAWQTARMQKMRRMKPLSAELKHLRDRPRAGPQSTAELRSSILAMAQASGARIVKVPKGSLKGMIHHGHGNRRTPGAPKREHR